MSGTPNTPRCIAARSDKLLTWDTNWLYTNWPESTEFTAPMRLVPYSLSTLVSAILVAEAAGHHVRAVGSTWSMSDAAIPTDSAAATPFGALVYTSNLVSGITRNGVPFSGLQDTAGAILLPTANNYAFLFHVEAAVSATNLYQMLDVVPGRQAVDAGGASGQTLGGGIFTGTHGGDSLSPPLCDYVCAIHLVGAGGVEYWIERDSPITDRAALQNVYPCLASSNIRYNTRLLNAVLVSAGSMGVIYSIILKTVPQYGVAQHRVATTWESIGPNLLTGLGVNLDAVLDGSFMMSMVGKTNILDGTAIGRSQWPYQPNRFSQIVINPYPLLSNDATLSASEKNHIGEHLCLVTNRAAIEIPSDPTPPGPPLDGLANALGTAAMNSLGTNLIYLAQWVIFQNQVQGEDNNTQAAALLSFLESNAGAWGQRTISAAINCGLVQLQPIGDQVNISYGLGDAEGWSASFKITLRRGCLRPSKRSDIRPGCV